MIVTEKSAQATGIIRRFRRFEMWNELWICRQRKLTSESIRWSIELRNMQMGDDGLVISIHPANQKRFEYLKEGRRKNSTWCMEMES